MGSEKSRQTWNGWVRFYWSGHDEIGQGRLANTWTEAMRCYLARYGAVRRGRRDSVQQDMECSRRDLADEASYEGNGVVRFVEEGRRGSPSCGKVAFGSARCGLPWHEPTRRGSYGIN